MTAPETILPPSSTPLERALDRTPAARIGNLPAVVSSLWNAATCPAALLPYLAWALSVDEWDEKWGEDKKRAVIAESRLIHQHKGTPAAIKRALAAIGQPDATVIERGNYARYNSTITYDASSNHQGSGGWASYRIILKRAISIDQAFQIRRLLAAVQRNCIALTAIDFSEANNLYNRKITYDGTYTHGVVDTSI